MVRPTCAAVLPYGKHFANTPDPERPLKLGFVSPKFNGKIVGQFLRPVFSALDRGQFLIHCYSNSQQWIRSRTSCEPCIFVERIQTLDDSQAAHKIETDRIDILIDLAAHIPANRLLAFRRSPLRYRWHGSTILTPRVSLRWTAS